MNTKYATVFPGQGSQSVGMLSSLAENFPEVKQTFKAASAVLNYDLWELIQKGPEEVLNQTEKTQPALLAAGVAVWRIWQTKKNNLPTYLAGHSLGEYTALVCADALDFQTAIKLVAARGKYMQEAVPAGKGAMAAIVGLENEQVAKLCHETGRIVSPANYNSIGQVVIAGEVEAVNHVINEAKNANAKMAKLLPVSVPSHCALMKPAAEKLAIDLKDITINTPQIPVINNVDVTVYTNPDEIRSALIKQLYLPVRWVETIQFLEKHEIKTILEMGPGKVLCGLIKRISENIQTVAINNLEGLQQAEQMLQKEGKINA